MPVKVTKQWALICPTCGTPWGYSDTRAASLEILRSMAFDGPYRHAQCHTIDGQLAEYCPNVEVNHCLERYLKSKS